MFAILCFSVLCFSVMEADFYMAELTATIIIGRKIDYSFWKSKMMCWYSDNSFPNIATLTMVVSVIPVTTCTMERSKIEEPLRRWKLALKAPKLLKL